MAALEQASSSSANAGRMSPPPSPTPPASSSTPPRISASSLTPSNSSSNLQRTPSKEFQDSYDHDSPKKKMQKNNMTSPAKPPGTPATQEARALNLSLENALQVTLRLEVADSSTFYLGDMVTTSEFLNSTNFSEVICARLSTRGDILNAVSYLVGCYKRLSSKELTSSGNLRDELIK